MLSKVEQLRTQISTDFSGNHVPTLWS